jgi:transcriptional regulator with AAA-type ATPase domain
MTSRPNTPEAAPIPPSEDDTHQDDRERLRAKPQTFQEYLFVVLEADRPLAGGARYGLDEVDEVIIGRGRERAVTREVTAGIRRLLLRLPSRLLSSVHARIRRVGLEWHATDAGSTNGSYLNGERVAATPLRDHDVFEVGRVFLMLSGVTGAEPAPDLDAGALAAQTSAFATLHPALAVSFSELQRVAASNLTVVLWGETGTGKEVLAAALHQLSCRTGAMVAVNCGALPSALIESQLFGHVRGAFSGAWTDSAGFVRAAERGTLLLDEVQDLSSSAQAALLRVLQEREVVPVGSTRPVHVDVRFLATAPRPLERAVEAGKFRADLQGRLQGLSYGLLPLRERRQDLGLLIAALLRKAGVLESDATSLSLEFAVALFQHAWPLNVRELEQVLARGLSLARGGSIDVSLETQPLPSRAEESKSPLTAAEQQLRERLVAELDRTQGNIARASRTLGKAPMQIRRWLRRFDIDPDAYRRR